MNQLSAKCKHKWNLNESGAGKLTQIVGFLKAAKNVLRRRCCLCHMTWAGLDQNWAKVSMNLLPFAGLYHFFQSGDLVPLYWTRLTCPHTWEWDGRAGCVGEWHKCTKMLVHIPSASFCVRWVRLDYFWRWAQSTCGYGFGQFQQPQKDENQLNKSKLVFFTLHLVWLTTVN